MNLGRAFIVTFALLALALPGVTSAALIAEQPDNSSSHTFITTNQTHAHAPAFTATQNYTLGSLVTVSQDFTCSATAQGSLRFSANIPVGKNLSAYIFHDSATPTPHGLNQNVWGDLPNCNGYIPGNGVMTDYTMPVTLPYAGSGGLPDTGILDGNTYHLVFGEVSGYYMETEFKTDASNNISYQLFADATSTPATTTPPVCTVNCNSNVMFLPGVQATRLFAPGNVFEDQLWEPGNQGDVEGLFLNDQGESVRNDIYVKEGDVIDAIPVSTSNIYKSFLNDLEQWKSADNLIQDYSIAAYDWRLSIDDILEYGNQDGEKIYYSGTQRGTSTPYILQELRRLASDSRNGKVTIVAHSNGGLHREKEFEVA